MHEPRRQRALTFAELHGHKGRQITCNMYGGITLFGGIRHFKKEKCLYVRSLSTIKWLSPPIPMRTPYPPLFFLILLPPLPLSPLPLPLFPLHKDANGAAINDSYPSYPPCHP